MVLRAKFVLIAIVCWNLICLAMMFIYPHTVGHVVIALYTAYFGDIQASYSTYARISVFVGLVVITTPATLVSLGLCHVLVHKPWSWKLWILAAVVWQVLLIPILIWSYESGFSYKINQLDWAVFGPPVEIYSVRNLVLHRIVAWLVCTIPVGSTVLWAYSRKSSIERARVKRGLCIRCGYDLTGNVSGTCPECGRASPVRPHGAD